MRWRAARCEGRGFGRLRGTVWAGVVLAATRRHAPKRSMRPPDSEKVPKIDPGDDSLKREDRQQKNRVFLCMFLLRVTTAARGIGVESGGAEHKYRASLSPPTEEHTQPPLKVGSVRCDTAAAVAAASWRGGPLYCAGSILARLPPSIGGVERCSKGHPKHTTHTHETWQGKHNYLPPPPTTTTTSTKTPMAMFASGTTSRRGRRLGAGFELASAVLAA